MSEDIRRERIVPHATYRRELPVSIERLYENAIDWEHLPSRSASLMASLPGGVGTLAPPRQERYIIEQVSARCIHRKLSSGT